NTSRYLLRSLSHDTKVNKYKYLKRTIRYTNIILLARQTIVRYCLFDLDKPDRHGVTFTHNAYEIIPSRYTRKIYDTAALQPLDLRLSHAHATHGIYLNNGTVVRIIDVQKGPAWIWKGSNTIHHLAYAGCYHQP